MHRDLIAILALLCTASWAPAQCRVLPNTGCPTALAPVCTGSTAIGQTLNVNLNPGGLPELRSVAAVGLPSATAIPIGPQLGTCGSSTCVLVLGPGTVWMGRGLLQNLTIPNDSRLIGQTVWLQGAMWIGFPGSGQCLVVPPAVAITITA